MIDGKTSRFLRYLESVGRCNDMLAMAMYPDLEQRPFHDPSAFPIVSDLERAYADIDREVAALERESFHRESERVERTGAWSVFMLVERGRRHDANCDRCPVLAELIERHRTVRTMAGIAYLSRTAPGTQIAPHCGPTNLRVRCHLALRVPPGDCALRVGAEVRSWEEGKCLVFDDSLEHESWNRTSAVRTVAIVDLWHPDLSDAEVLLLQGLHGYAAAHAENLTRYWMANERLRERLRAVVS